MIQVLAFKYNLCNENNFCMCWMVGYASVCMENGLPKKENRNDFFIFHFSLWKMGIEAPGERDRRERNTGVASHEWRKEEWETKIKSVIE